MIISRTEAFLNVLEANSSTFYFSLLIILSSLVVFRPLFEGCTSSTSSIVVSE